MSQSNILPLQLNKDASHISLNRIFNILIYCMSEFEHYLNGEKCIFVLLFIREFIRVIYFNLSRKTKVRQKV